MTHSHKEFQVLVGVSTCMTPLHLPKVYESFGLWWSCPKITWLCWEEISIGLLCLHSFCNDGEHCSLYSLHGFPKICLGISYSGLNSLGFRNCTLPFGALVHLPFGQVQLCVICLCNFILILLGFNNFCIFGKVCINSNLLTCMNCGVNME